jgi:hypothetical protein
MWRRNSHAAIFQARLGARRCRCESSSLEARFAIWSRDPKARGRTIGEPEDESFDLIVANAVFHHLEDVEGDLVEFVRCAKPGKLLLINEVVEDNSLMHGARNIFKAWRGIPIKSRMYVSECSEPYRMRSYCLHFFPKLGDPTS